MDQRPPHLPVMLKETISLLFTNPDGTYLDGTIGFGGHAAALMQNLSKNGYLIGIDLDPYALECTEKHLSAPRNSYSLHNSNYREYPFLLQNLGVDKLAGILFDLGTSSSQINTGYRGFSFQTDAPLDMRLNTDSNYNAYNFLNESSEFEIGNVIKEYGEERYYKNISLNIYQAVKLKKMNTTFDLRRAISKCVHPRFLNKSLARVFQAIRIKVNDELSSLIDGLNQSIKYLEKGGRIAVISFHSLEDRIVKKFYKKCTITCICPKEYPICQCNTKASLKILTKRAVIPSTIEVKNNPRSRSAKLRVAERV